MSKGQARYGLAASLILLETDLCFSDILGIIAKYFCMLKWSGEASKRDDS